MERLIAICGAGGKTTRLDQLKDFYVHLGKRVLVTTTTKMGREPHAVVSGKTEDIRRRVEEEGWAFAGLPDPNAPKEKITGLPVEVLKECETFCDILLVEADGARHHSVKVPNETDLQIPEGTTDILIVMGLFEIGKCAGEVIHRFPILQKHTGMDEKMIVTPSLVREIVRDYYRTPLSENYPSARIKVEYTVRDKEGTLCYMGESYVETI